MHLLIRAVERHLGFDMDTTVLPFSVIQAIARKWARKHPDLRERLARAVALVPNVHETRCSGHFMVEGSDGNVYHVEVKRGWSACTCPDSARGNHCKHRLAVALAVVAAGKLKEVL